MPECLDEKYGKNNAACNHYNQGEKPQGHDVIIVYIVYENIKHYEAEYNLGQRDQVTHQH